MAAIATLAAGLWSAAGTWIGGVPPTIGDTFTINHAVTVDGTYTVGTDPGSASNPASFAASTIGTLNAPLKASRLLNSQLNLRGSLNVAGGGTLDYGTAIDPIPGAVTAVITFDSTGNLSTANAKYGFAGVSGCKLYVQSAAPRTRFCRLFASVSAAGTTLIATDGTNWAVGDRIVIAATDATPSHYEEFTINAVSSTPQTGYPNAVTVTLGAIGAPATPASFVNGHAALGAVGNFTSNVTFKNNVAMAWHSHVFVNSASGTGGFEIRDLVTEGTAAPLTTYSTSPGFFGFGLDIASNTKGTTTITGMSRCAAYKPYTYAWAAIGFGQTFAPTDMVVFQPTNSTAFSGFINSGTITNATYCATFGQAPGVSTGNFGVNGSQAWSNSWFTGNYGFINPSQTNDVTFNDCVFGCCTARNMAVTPANFKFNRCDFGAVTGGIGAMTIGSDVFDMSIASSSIQVLCTDCRFQPSISINSSMTNVPSNTKITLANRDVDPLKQETYTPAGNLSRDNSVFRTASPSVKITPTDANNSLTITFQVFAPTGTPVIVSGYWERDSSFSLAGTRPTAVLSGLGITASTFTMSASLAATTWEQWVVSGTQSTGTDGMLTLTLSFQGTAGNCWVDDISAPPAAAVNSGALGFWTAGSPVGAVLANFVSATDVWNVLTSNLTLAGSVGQRAADALTRTEFDRTL